MSFSRGYNLKSQGDILMPEQKEIKKDDVTERAPTDPMKSENELSDSDLEKAAGGRFI